MLPSTLEVVAIEEAKPKSKSKLSSGYKMRSKAGLLV